MLFLQTISEALQGLLKRKVRLSFMQLQVLPALGNIAASIEHVVDEVCPVARGFRAM